jgi:hypothetical protein
MSAAREKGSLPALALGSSYLTQGADWAVVLWVVMLGKTEVAGKHREAVGLQSQVGAALAAGVGRPPSGRMAATMLFLHPVHPATSTGRAAAVLCLGPGARR